MAIFKAGFHRCDITPPIGVGLIGSFNQRLARGVHDPLTASALALSDGEKNFLLVSVDNIGIPQDTMGEVKAAIEVATAIPPTHIFVHSTHTHTGPSMSRVWYPEDFSEEVFAKTVATIASAAQKAVEDLSPAAVFVNAANTPVPITFIRRFMMKDGQTRTNPGFLNPDIDHPLGEADHRVALTLFKREKGPEIALINFQVHPCVVPQGEEAFRISADFPHYFRKTYEAAMPNSVCMFINGAQGDTNHYNVTTPPELPRTGHEFAAHMGRTLAGTAMSLHGMARPIAPLPLRSELRTVTVAHNKAESEEQLIWARRIKALYDAGKYDEVCPLGGMALTTVIAEATRMLTLEAFPDGKEIHLMGLRMGDFALVGFPGEPFTEIGLKLKKASPANMTFVACCANGQDGYFPSQSAYDEGGYEAKTARYRAGTAEILLREAEGILSALFCE